MARVARRLIQPEQCASAGVFGPPAGPRPNRRGRWQQSIFFNRSPLAGLVSPHYDRGAAPAAAWIGDFIDGLPCGPAQAHQAVGDHRRHRQGARAQSGRPQRHRARRRRAGFRHARQHQRRRRSRRSATARRRNTPTSTASPSSRTRSQASSSARTASTTRPSQITVGTGGKQVLYNAFDGDAQSGRRGDHPGALLGELSRHGAARRRQAGRGRDHDGDRASR